jgi:hypothetical protein
VAPLIWAVRASTGHRGTYEDVSGQTTVALLPPEGVLSSYDERLKFAPATAEAANPIVLG